MNGDQDNNLRPADEITKAEFLTMLIRHQTGYTVNTRKRYVDVVAGNWFGGYAQAVFRYGLAKQTKDIFIPMLRLQPMLPVCSEYGICIGCRFEDAQKAVFTEGLTREEAAYLIISYMEAIGK